MHRHMLGFFTFGLLLESYALELGKSVTVLFPLTTSDKLRKT